MALDKDALMKGIQAALDAAKEKKSPEEAADALARGIADAVHAYVSAGQVHIDVRDAGGQVIGAGDGGVK